MHGLISTVKQEAARKARVASLSLLAGLLALVGAGFLTAALWIVLARLEDALFATLIVAAIYFGLALLAGTAALLQRRPVVHEQEAREVGVKAEAKAEVDPTVARLIEAFLAGLSAGRSARRY